MSRQRINSDTGYSPTCAILFMVDPAVATVSICLPSIWFLVGSCFKRLPTDSFRSKWSNRYITLVNSTKRKSEASRLPSNATPTLPTRSKFAPPVSRATVVEEKDYLMTVEERIPPVSGRPSPIMKEETQEERVWPVTRSMEIEARVRNYYDGAAFDYRARDTVQLYKDSSEHLEVGTSPLRENRLPVPPKGRFATPTLP